MSILYEPNYLPQVNDLPLTHARIGHSRNWLSGGTALASTTAAGYFADALLNSLTYEKWKPTALPASWEYDHPTAQLVDFCGIAGHTMGSSGAKLSVQRNGANRTNLFLRSAEFDNASWNKSNVTVTANAIASPDGTTTADKIVDTAINAAHFMTQAFDPALGTAYTVSVYAKAAERTFFQLIFTNDAFSTNLVGVFDLTLGVCASSAGEALVSITDAGGGWYRCSLSAQSTRDDTSTAVQLRLSTAYSTTANAYLGDGISGLHLWGAQLETGWAPTPYIPTTTAAVTTGNTNLFLRSQEFDNASWTKVDATVTANADTAPDGSLTADRILPNAVNNAHYISQAFATLAGTRYTMSIYAKAAGYTSIQMIYVGASWPATLITAFNLTTGVCQTNDVRATPTIENMGNGWYRCSISAVATATAATSFPQFRVTDAYSLGTPTYIGDTVSGVSMWGAQIITGSAIGSYTPTTTAAVSSEWIDILSFVSVPDNSPLMAMFAPVTADKFRVIVSGVTIPELSVVKFGRALQMERPIYGGHTPLDLARKTTYRTNLSETGQFLGKTKVRTQLGTQFAWKNLSAAWVRANWPSLQQAVESEPIFIAWRPASFAEVGYCMVDNTPAPTNSGTRDLMDVEMAVGGLAYD